MFCKKCGSQIEDGAGFCKKCGTPVEKVGKWSLGAKKVVMCTLVFQVLQLIFYFLPSFTLSIPRYEERESFSTRNALMDGELYDIDPTKAIIFLSVVAIFFTGLLLFKVYALTIVGHIVRLVSWFMIAIMYVGTWAALGLFTEEQSREIGVLVKLENSFLGITFHVVNIALFIVTIMLIPVIKKEKGNK